MTSGSAFLDADQSGLANLALYVWPYHTGDQTAPEGITRTVITYAVIARNVKNYDSSTAYSAALRSAVSSAT